MQDSTLGSHLVPRRKFSTQHTQETEGEQNELETNKSRTTKLSHVNVDEKHTGWRNNTRALIGNEPTFLRLWQQVLPYCFAGSWILCTATIVFFAFVDPLKAVLVCSLIMFGLLWERFLWAVFTPIAAFKICRRSAASSSQQKPINELAHVVYIAAYKEDLEVLTMTLNSLANQEGGNGLHSYAKCHVGIVLCKEAREGQAAEVKVAKLQKMFCDKFMFMRSTYHPDNLPGHVQGKGSNVSWAFEQTKHILHKIARRSEVMVTVADCDSEFDAQYFLTIAKMYMGGDKTNRDATIFQAPFLNFKNYFSQKMSCRIASILFATTVVSFLEESILPGASLSTFSMSLPLVLQMNGFDPDFVAEDVHSSTKAFLANPLEFHVKHVPLPILNYSVHKDDTSDNFADQWSQLKRWALMVEDLIYLLQMLPITCAKSHSVFTGLRCWFRGILKFFKLSVGVLPYSLVAVQQAFFAVFWSGLLIQFLGYGHTLGVRWPLVHEYDTVGSIMESNILWLHMVLSCVIAVTYVWVFWCMVIVLRSATVSSRIESCKDEEQPWWRRNAIVMAVHEVWPVLVLGNLVYCAWSIAYVISFFTVATWDKKKFVWFLSSKPSSFHASRTSGHTSPLATSQK